MPAALTVEELLADPDIEAPTTAFPFVLIPLLTASHCGNSWVKNVSHLYVDAPLLPTAGRYQSE